MADEIFKVIDPAGKTFKIFANGETDGFGPGVVVVNRIPGALHAARLGLEPAVFSISPDVAAEVLGRVVEGWVEKE